MNTQEEAAAVFELFDSTLAEITPEWLGLWTTQSRMADVAFDLNSSVNAEVPLWRANFPADLRQVGQILTDCEARLEASQDALGQVPDRLDRLITLASLGGADDLAFGLSPTEQPLVQPEQELLAALQELQGVGEPQSFGVDFGVGEKLFGGWKQSYEQVQVLTKRAIEVIANYAQVETQIQGKTLARTTVGWTGDVNTVWIDGVNVEQRMLHQRSLALALASRNTLLQSFTMAVQLALKVSVSLTLPGGVIWALPAVWKFINQVVNNQRRKQLNEHPQF